MQRLLKLFDLDLQLLASLQILRCGLGHLLLLYHLLLDLQLLDLVHHFLVLPLKDEEVLAGAVDLVELLGDGWLHLGNGEPDLVFDGLKGKRFRAVTDRSFFAWIRVCLEIQDFHFSILVHVMHSFETCRSLGGRCRLSAGERALPGLCADGSFLRRARLVRYLALRERLGQDGRLVRCWASWPDLLRLLFECCVLALALRDLLHNGLLILLCLAHELLVSLVQALLRARGSVRGRLRLRA